MSAVTGVGALVIAMLASMALVQVVFPRLYGYALTPKRFEIRLFGRVPIYVLALRDLAGVEPWRLHGANPTGLFTTLRFGNRIFGRAIVLQRRSGFPRYLVVTPDDADRMLADLRAAIGAASRS